MSSSSPTPLYRIQRHYYETARVGVRQGQDQTLRAAIATDLRKLSARALLDDFLSRSRLSARPHR
ncbi:hypothetical protein [Saccharothrix sp. ALI-22-I]|uniref:hypothetical protein n=1 Tax=Saccharothrix sp. ALI-22-I TaxID=1933778 RepID=UPI001EE7442F|nr:hypothetical protein [Saccharothrix sp. ALI-22-I]